MRGSKVTFPALLAAGFALAIAAPAAAEVPTYGALGKGELTRVPIGKPLPRAIPAGERVAGLFVVRPKFGSEVPPQARYALVTTDAKIAREVETKGNEQDEASPGTCFAESDGESNDGNDPLAAHWDPTGQRLLNLWPHSGDNPGAGLRAVHTERFVEENGQARLDSLDAYVDPGTRGSRLLGRASLPLTLVGRAVGGIRVFAGRDERAGETARVVQFVVVRDDDDRLSRRGTMMGLRQDGTSAHGNCGHLRMPLLLDPKSAGDSATIVAPVELSSSPVAMPEPEATSLREREDARDVADENARAAKKPKRFRKPASKAPAPPTTMVEREVRSRELQISLSVSQTTRDKEPVLGVAYGWAGRETNERVMDEVPTQPDAVRE